MGGVKSFLIEYVASTLAISAPVTLTTAAQSAHRATPGEAGMREYWP
jgi:hypothetical protein